MEDTPNPVCSGHIANQNLTLRFAELDAQIQIHEVNRHKPAERKPKRRRARPARPREVRKEITRCAKQLRQFLEDVNLGPNVKIF
jgi:hypothetical protein